MLSNKDIIVFATNNAHKLQEVRQILGERFEVRSLKEIGCHEELPETHDTLEGNAIEKAQYVNQHYGYDCFADDTGLEVDALNGEPGVYSARYATIDGADHDSEANMQKLLRNMQGLDNRKAQFRTTIALIYHGETHLFEGKVEGCIATEKHGAEGFGYDPIFYPEGYSPAETDKPLTFAEMSAAEKNGMSHRGRAVEKLVAFFQKSEQAAARLMKIREVMKRESLDAVIIPSSDPHNSEYVSPHWQGRKWISGFTGSAGTAVVTMDEAALWTDSRYFIQAERELSGEWQLMKEYMPETPTIAEWLKRKMSLLPNGGIVCVDGMVMPYEEITQLTKELRTIGCTMRTNYDALSTIWDNRPAKPSNDIFPVDSSIIGETTAAKLQRLRTAMGACDAYVMTDLAEIAWTLNLRGSDVLMTPVFIAYLYVTHSDARVFVNGSCTPEAQAMLIEAGVAIEKYDDFVIFLKKKSSKGTLTLCSSKTTNYTIFNIIRENVRDCDSPAGMMKAIKNDAEIEGFKRSMLRDGVAMVRFLRWLKPAVEAGGQTELTVSENLEQLRKEEDMETSSLPALAAKKFMYLSFGTICGYNENGAIVHYAVTPATAKTLKAEGLLLLDSGAQYSDGTTDITRTIALGRLTPEMRRVYTLVLKAHIALASISFPEGTNGTNLDTIPHSVLWRGKVDYMHGSGHGVGSCLSVHEGPQSMRQRWCPAPLQEGMTLTIEPGVYLEGKFGIRVENTMLVKRDNSVNGEKKWLTFEPLTLCPIDTTPIEMDMMEQYEKDYLNDYHALVREKLLPLLSNPDDKAWLIENTKKI